MLVHHEEVLRRSDHVLLIIVGQLHCEATVRRGDTFYVRNPPVVCHSPDNLQTAPRIQNVRHLDFGHVLRGSPKASLLVVDSAPGSARRRVLCPAIVFTAKPCAQRTAPIVPHPEYLAEERQTVGDRPDHSMEHRGGMGAGRFARQENIVAVPVTMIPSIPPAPHVITKRTLFPPLVQRVPMENVCSDGIGAPVTVEPFFVEQIDKVVRACRNPFAADLDPLRQTELIIDRIGPVPPAQHGVPPAFIIDRETVAATVALMLGTERGHPAIVYAVIDRFRRAAESRRCGCCRGDAWSAL